MKNNLFIIVTLLSISKLQLCAQTTPAEKPVKTGNEWKMPTDVLKRSRAFAEDLQRKLKLDSLQMKKVYETYLANTKPLDEISILPISDKEKQSRVKTNKAAFDERLKQILSVSQYEKYQAMK